MFFLPSTLYPLSYPTVAPGTKSIDIPGYGIYKDIELVETLTSREFSWTLKLRSTHLDCFFYDFQGLHFPWNRSSKYFFRKKRIPTCPFFVIQSPQFMMSTTLSWLSTSISAGVAIPWPDLLNKPSVQRIVQVRQAKAEKVKSVNKTGISADQCRILMNVTSNPTDLIPLSK